MARCKLVKSKKQKIESEGYFRGIKICKKKIWIIINILTTKTTTTNP